ncbi:hypothetical protein IscW_ISCW013226 [Ixodes scapularis]|uniref:Uncharacterized protein n=1 Tax=Ixodes scapularis TaxID=6945 RepID=B7QC78_IXOSC|nr:hypothetical protein IscW_ISCW013226 [Ixodes scapularis]|eukprot:XP_002413142.1 hypothetical protein IscW_ISCW013226 [Ixodes scapularis]
MAPSPGGYATSGLDGVSSFSVPGSKIISLGNNVFNKAVRKTTTNVVSPAFKKAVQASE